MGQPKSTTLKIAQSPRAEATLSASFQTAGSYLLSADAAEEPLAGTRILIVVPGATDPSKCMVFGEAAAGVRVGRPNPSYHPRRG